jgi:hypothetical protein
MPYIPFSLVFSIDEFKGITTKIICQDVAEGKLDFKF